MATEWLKQELVPNDLKNKKLTLPKLVPNHTKLLNQIKETDWVSSSILEMLFSRYKVPLHNSSGWANYVLDNFPKL